MADVRRLQVTPPGAEDDDDRLRRALGHAGPAAPPPPAPSPAPEASPAVTPPARQAPSAAKMTVSVRLSPDIHARLSEVADAIGWSQNKIMGILVENGAQRLIDAWTAEGETAALRLLRGR